MMNDLMHTKDTELHLGLKNTMQNIIYMYV